MDDDTPSGPAMPPWATKILYALAAGLVVFYFHQNNNKRELSEQEIWRIKGQMEVIVRTVDNNAERHTVTATKLQEIGAKQEARGDRMLNLEFSARSIGEELKKETDRIHTRFDKMETQVTEIYRALQEAKSHKPLEKGK
jgi:DNA-binding FrmR family transcriptional regulator